MPILKVFLRRQFGINRKELYGEYEKTGKIQNLKPPSPEAARHVSMVIARRLTEQNKSLEEIDAVKKRFKPKSY